MAKSKQELEQVKKEETEKKLKSFTCPKCKKIPENNDYCILTCKHMICFNCSLEMINNEEKKCPTCDEEIGKENTYIQFKD
jgi:hypothetical protein